MKKFINEKQIELSKCCLGCLTKNIDQLFHRFWLLATKIFFKARMIIYNAILVSRNIKLFDNFFKNNFDIDLFPIMKKASDSNDKFFHYHTIE